MTYMNKNQITWVVQGNLGSRKDVESIKFVCEEQGFLFKEVSITPFSNEIPEIPSEGTTIFYGSSNFMNNVYHNNRWSPGVFFEESLFQYSVTQQHYGKLLLNGDAEITTMENFSSRNLSLDKVFFIRPNNDLKAFAGSLFLFSEFKSWCDRLRSGEFTVKLSMEVVVAKPRDISQEWRLFIVKGRVTSGSQYQIHGRLSTNKSLPSQVIVFAEKMAHMWTPADVFVMDVARCNGKLYVIEVNGFNSSGFYASDIDKIVREISGLYLEEIA